MTAGRAVDFRFRDETLQADPSGALIWPGRDSVVVADLHLEKGSAFAAAGTPLPPYDSRETLRRLGAVLDRVRPKRVICLGDSFHDGDAPDRLGPDETATLKRLTATYEWIWITGNHDPAPPEGLGGSGAREFRAANLTLRHEAARGPVEGEVSGHYHPKAGVSVRNRRVTGRCFVTDGLAPHLARVRRLCRRTGRARPGDRIAAAAPLYGVHFGARTRSPHSARGHRQPRAAARRTGAAVTINCHPAAGAIDDRV